MEVEIDGEEVKKVVGQKCKKGKKYAQKEVFSPGRVLTTTVKTDIPGLPLLPVRSDKEIPREKLLDCVSCISRHSIKDPIGLGQTVIENILGLGVNIVACRTVVPDEHFQQRAEQTG